MADLETGKGEEIETAVMTGRVRHRSDFLKARSGARSHGRAFVLQGVARHDGDPQIRFGYTVTKKVGIAVERNRIKRRFRAAIKAVSLNGDFPAKLAGHDVIVIAKRAALTDPYEELVSALVKALRQLVANGRPKGQKRRDKPGHSKTTGDAGAQDLSKVG